MFSDHLSFNNFSLRYSFFLLTLLRHKIIVDHLKKLSNSRPYNESVMTNYVLCSGLYLKFNILLFRSVNVVVVCRVPAPYNLIAPYEWSMRFWGSLRTEWRLCFAQVDLIERPSGRHWTRPMPFSQSACFGLEVTKSQSRVSPDSGSVQRKRHLFAILQLRGICLCVITLSAGRYFFYQGRHFFRQ